MNLPTSRTVIITGGNSGIGRGIAEAFARENTQVVIMGRNEETLRTTIEHLGPKALCKQVDITQSAQVADAVTAVVQQFGQIDVLVNAAGLPRWITTETPFDRAEQLWDEVVNTNLKGSFLMAMAVAPYLTRPGGRIINISTNAAFTGGGCPGYLGYAAAKAGVHGLTYALARELSPQGITVNAIAPGLIANTAITNMWSEDRLQSIVAETPVGRAGCVDDVAAAVLYLASKEASFITGEVLNINGGLVFGH